jgi:hypothetical protein
VRNGNGPCPTGVLGGRRSDVIGEPSTLLEVLLSTLGELDLEEDMSFTRLEWRVTRVLWAGGLVLILAGASGMFGAGPVSRATVVSASSQLRIEYPRFARVERTEVFRLLISSAGIKHDTATIWIDVDYLKSVGNIELFPFVAQQSQADRILFKIAVSPGDSATVFISVKPQLCGLAHCADRIAEWRFSHSSPGYLSMTYAPRIAE